MQIPTDCMQCVFPGAGYCQKGDKSSTHPVASCEHYYSEQSNNTYKFYRHHWWMYLRGVNNGTKKHCNLQKTQLSCEGKNCIFCWYFLSNDIDQLSHHLHVVGMFACNQDASIYWNSNCYGLLWKLPSEFRCSSEVSVNTGLLSTGICATDWTLNKR